MSRRTLRGRRRRPDGGGASPRPARAVAADFCVDWPTMPSDDDVPESARLLVMNLRDAMAGRSIREVASIMGVDRATIGAMLVGQFWPDIVTLVKLERGLGPLWHGGTGSKDY